MTSKDMTLSVYTMFSFLVSELWTGEAEEVGGLLVSEAVRASSPLTAIPPSLPLPPWLPSAHQASGVALPRQNRFLSSLTPIIAL